MKIIEILTKYKKKIAFMSMIVLITTSIGAFGGIRYYKQLLKANAIGFWITGVESLKENKYDYALIYFSQAIALKNDDPMFYHSMAETYEAKQNTAMALEFYKLALEHYKRENSCSIKLIENKIDYLQKRKEEG